MLEAVLIGAIVSVVAWGMYARRGRSEPVYWTSVSINQLELHHKMTIAMADRVHLDPSIRDALRHQVEVLKAIGVAGTKEEAIDVTEEAPTAAQLTAYGPRADGGSPILNPAPYRRVDVDEWNRKRGYRVHGDAESSGFGEYQREEEGEA